MLVNIVGRVPSYQWERECPPDLNIDFVHTTEPVVADLHVVYGLSRRLRVPNSPSRMIFVACEPPEIKRYDLSVVSRYGYAIGPDFEYLREVPTYQPIEAIAPWWVGMKAGAGQEYEPENSPATISRERFKSGFTPTRNTVTAIVSQKSGTLMQKQRLRLVDYLLSHLADFEVHGLSKEKVKDKAEVLMDSRYHLAIENSLHRGYWTEKLADPILMDNYVFYRGHPATQRRFPESVTSINPSEPEETYRIISEALSQGAWEISEHGRFQNRNLLLDGLSFHRSLAVFIREKRFPPRKFGSTIVPEHHPNRRFLLNPRSRHPKMPRG